MAKKDKAQSKRFIEKAKELGSDETGEKFNRALKQIVSDKQSKNKKNINEVDSKIGI